MCRRAGKAIGSSPVTSNHSPADDRDRNLAPDRAPALDDRAGDLGRARGARGRGGEARFVGGAVRDALLGRPIGDIDIATPATPERVIELLEKRGIKVVPTGLAHGTVTA